MVVYGVILGLSGSIFINVGNNIQSTAMHQLEVAEMKKQMDQGEHPELNQNIEPSKSKLWIFGTCTFVMGSLLNFLSYSYAPQCILASLESIQFVTNVLYAKFITKNVISWKMTAGVIVTITGTCGAVLFAPGSGAKICNVKDLIYLFYNPDSPKRSLAWEIYMVVAFATSVALWATYNFYDKMITQDNISDKRKGEVKFIMMICYSVLAAVGFGTTQVVLAKMLGYFTSLALWPTDCADPDLFTSWFPYVVIPIWLVLVSQWLMRLNGGLAKFDPITFLPIIQGNFILFSIISGAICYQEFVVMESTYLTLSPLATWIGFILGCAVMFYGLYLICSDQAGGSEDASKLIEEGFTASDSTEKPRRPSLTQQTSRYARRTGSITGVTKGEKVQISDVSRFFTSGAAQMTELKYFQDKIKIQEDFIAKLASGKTIDHNKVSEVRDNMIKIIAEEKRVKEAEASMRHAQAGLETQQASDIELMNVDTKPNTQITGAASADIANMEGDDSGMESI